jgi:NAD(P)-dependent dehydrogenase (short-subunit alcohol dehydrogenase family)
MSVKALFDLNGKVALITGGSRGLGLQMAHALGELGAKLAIAARKESELQAAKDELTKAGYTAEYFVADLSSMEAAQQLAQAVMTRFSQIDILINNAGASWGSSAVDYPAEAWNKVINLNLNGTFFLTQAVGKLSMVPRKQGKVITIASIAGLQGNPPPMYTIAYNTTKGGLVNFTRALAAEWGQYGINVNAIAPGFFPSKMSAGLLSVMGENIVKGTPLNRLGGEEDLKGAIAFLASDASRHMTGQILAVDGGASII